MHWKGVGHWCSCQAPWSRTPSQSLATSIKGCPLHHHPPPPHTWSSCGAGRGNLGGNESPGGNPRTAGGPLQEPSIPRCQTVQRTFLCHVIPRRGCKSLCGLSRCLSVWGMLGSSSGIQKAELPEPLLTGVCGGGSPPAGPTAGFLPLTRAESLEHLSARCGFDFLPSV